MYTTGVGPRSARRRARGCVDERFGGLGVAGLRIGGGGEETRPAAAAATTTTTTTSATPPLRAGASTRTRTGYPAGVPAATGFTSPLAPASRPRRRRAGGAGPRRNPSTTDGGARRTVTVTVTAACTRATGRPELRVGPAPSDSTRTWRATSRRKDTGGRAGSSTG